LSYEIWGRKAKRPQLSSGHFFFSCFLLSHHSRRTEIVIEIETVIEIKIVCWRSLKIALFLKKEGFLSLDYMKRVAAYAVL